MTLALRDPHANDNRQISRALTALVAAVLGLFAAVAAIVYLGITPSDMAETATADRQEHGALTRTPACIEALERAKASRTLPSREAVAASTAMLRACNVH